MLPLPTRPFDPLAPCRPILLLAATVLALSAGCQGRGRPWEGVGPKEFEAIERHRNVGIARLEEGQFKQAADEFTAITQTAPNLAFGYGNLAVADLRMNRPPEALKAAQEAQDRLPRDPQVQSILAEAQSAAGRNDEAIRTLEAVTQADPPPVRPLYRLIELYRLSPTGHEAAIPRALERLVKAVPYNIVAELEWAKAAAQAGNARAALAAVDRVAALAGSSAVSESYLQAARAPLQAGNAAAAVGPLQVLINVSKPTPRYQADLFEIDGEPTDPHGLTLREFVPPPPPALRPVPPPPIPVRFVDTSAEWGLPAGAATSTAGPPSSHPLAVGDYDGDGKPDLFVADPAGHSRLWHNTGRRFTDVTAALGLPPLAATSAQFIDVDNDRRLDLVLSTPAGLRYFRNTGSRFVDLTAATRLTGPGAVRQTLGADLDVDGDLDLLALSAAGPSRLYRNNMDRTFTDVTAGAGLGPPLPEARAAVFGDFDENGAPDLLLISERAPGRLYLNQYGGRFRLAPEFGAAVPAGARAAVVEDFDHDSYLDVAVVGGAPAAQLLLYNEAGKRFRAETGLQAALGSFAATAVASLDYDNDGWQDLVVVGPDGLRLLHNDGGHQFRDHSDLLPKIRGSVGVEAADVDGDGAADLLVARSGGGVALLRNEGGSRNHWLKAQLLAVDVAGAKNNVYGIGNTIEVKAASLYQKRLVTDPITSFGLDGIASVDTMRVVWTNGTPQNHLAPAANQLVQEKLQLKGSCPFLYTWDGERYRFVTDILWRSPLGLRLSASRFAPHDQTGDWVRIPHGVLKGTEGFYDLTITEELWETLYLDLARLVVVDHPAGADVYLDERMNFGPPLPFRLYTVQHPQVPRAVTDGQGRSWRAAVARRDGVYSHAFEPTRYQGVTKPSTLLLDLGPLPADAPVRLFLTGWIFPTDTSINMAVSQNGAIKLQPLQVAVTDRNGRWRTIVPALGLPAGKNKTMVIDLGRFQGKEHRAKLTTTAQLYWDQIFFTVGESPVPIRATRLRPVQTDLHYLGFCRTYREGENGPFLYDHGRVDRHPRWRDQEGLFTRYGEVTSLLQQVDDQYVIMNAGDELWVRFDGRRLPPLPPGWVRDFVLQTDGWDKDADRNTATGSTVEPLPFHGMKQYPYEPGERYPETAALRRYRAEYNTRRVSARPFREAILRGRSPYPVGP